MNKLETVYALVGVILLAMLSSVLMLYWYARLFEGGYLPPILNSHWLYIHVPLILTAYGSAVAALVCSAIALGAHKLVPKVSFFLQLLALVTFSFGIITGALWANESWGRYWGWDPVELLSMVVWWVMVVVVVLVKVNVPAVIKVLLLGLQVAVILVLIIVELKLPGLHAYSPFY
jgi:ABC-type transport system involved in cytochrome c biogenesis permease subunit